MVPGGRDPAPGGGGNTGRRNPAAARGRRNTATTRSGWRSVITSDQIPPPEWPHKIHGTALNSAWPDLDPSFSRALRNALSDPIVGSNHSCEPPGVVSIASFNT